MNDKHKEAFKDDNFLESKEGRSVRILSEYERINSTLESHHIMNTLTFFGSARFLSKEEAEKKLSEAKENNSNIKNAEMDLENSAYYEQARSLAFKFTKWVQEQSTNVNRFVVATGAGPGIMEAANRGAHEAKGKTIGFGIKLPMEQNNNKYITTELSFKFYYFFMRKFFLTYMAKATFIFPGGIGTIDELCEIWTLKQTERLQKPMPIVLVGRSYWQKLINFNFLVEKKVIDKEDLDHILMTDDIDEAFIFVTSILNKNI